MIALSVTSSSTGAARSRRPHVLGDQAVQAGVAQVTGRDVHGDVAVAAAHPASRMAPGLAQRRGAAPTGPARGSQTDVLGDGDEAVGRDRAVAGWVQRASASIPTTRPVREVDDRLVVQVQLVGGRAPGAGRRRARSAPAPLGREVGRRAGAGAGRPASRRTSRCRRGAAGARPRATARARCRWWRSTCGCRRRPGRARRAPAAGPRRASRARARSSTSSQTTRNSSPAKRATVSVGRAPARSRVGHPHQQLVADGVAPGVVDDLELVEVDEEHGRAAGLAGQGVLETVEEQGPVGQPGEVVVQHRLASSPSRRRASVTSLTMARYAGWSPSPRRPRAGRRRSAASGCDRRGGRRSPRSGPGRGGPGRSAAPGGARAPDTRSPTSRW